MNDGFQFEVPEYSPGLVIRLLTHYADMRGTVTGGLGTPMKTTYKQTVKYTFSEKPLGASTSFPWPFTHKPHVQDKPNGKKRAMMAEEISVALIDVEDALQKLGDDDFSLIYEYYILGGITLDELAAKRGLKSRGRLHERIQRIIMRMVKSMNGSNIEQLRT